MDANVARNSIAHNLNGHCLHDHWSRGPGKERPVAPAVSGDETTVVVVAGVARRAAIGANERHRLRAALLGVHQLERAGRECFPAWLARDGYHGIDGKPENRNAHTHQGDEMAETGRRLNHIAAETAMLEERWLELHAEIEALATGG